MPAEHAYLPDMPQLMTAEELLDTSVPNKRTELVRGRHTYLEFAPNLVVEVLSHNDRPGEVLAKVGDWLDAGARLVWVVDPERRLARVYREDGTEYMLGETDQLLGEDVLPGFSCGLASILSQ